MGPFDFLNNIKRGLEQYFQPSMNQVSNTLQQYFPSRTMNYRLDKSPKAPDINPIIKAAQAKQPEPTQQPQRPTTQDFQAGFSRFGQNVPIATASPSFVEAAQRLPENIDPYLPAILALMESQGGLRAPAPNNAFSLMGTQNGQRGFVSYPDYATAILGGPNNGVQSKGFVGTILDNPAYAPFLQSGDLGDFFQVYTPPGEQYGNPSLEQLLSRYQSLRALFPGM